MRTITIPKQLSVTFSPECDPARAADSLRKLADYLQGGDLGGMNIVALRGGRDNALCGAVAITWEDRKNA